MTRSILTLCALLVAVSLAHAEPPTRRPLQTAGSAPAPYCRTLGTLSAAMASARDAGVPASALRAALRAEHQSAATQDVVEIVLDQVYAFPSLSEAVMRPVFEEICLRAVAQQQK